jgi:hypothetical protein
LTTPSGTPASRKAWNSAAGAAGVSSGHFAMIGRRLAHDLVDREVPGREGRDRAHGLLQHELVDVGHARRHDAAIGAAAFLGEPVDDVAGQHRLDLRLRQRLALLEGHEPGDVVGARAHQVGGLAHHLRAVVGRHLAPGLEALPRGREGAIEVLGAGMGDRADLLLGGGVQDGDRAAARGRAPLAVDQKLRARVHGCSSKGIPASRGAGTMAPASPGCKPQPALQPVFSRAASSL